jgi:dipeptidyl aminopeptidase/acylaminoacyl peptidase
MARIILKCICITPIIIILGSQANAQWNIKAQSKPVIDTGILGKWPQIVSAAISNDGQYSLYVERQGGHFVANEINKHIFNILHVVPTSYPALIKNYSQKGMTIEGVTSDAAFSNDCRYVYFRKEKDSFGILELRTNTIEYITDIKSFELSKEDDWLAYLTDSERLYVYNTHNGKKTNYENVIGYKFSNDGKALLIEEKNRNRKKPTQSLLWLDLIAYRLMKIWEGNNIDWNSCVFDRQSSRVAFMGSESTSMLVDQSIYYYEKSAAQTEVLVNKNSPGIENNFIFRDDRLKFSRNGDKLVFNVKKTNNLRTASKENYVDIDVWNYKDKYLQSDQLKPAFLHYIENAEWVAVIDIVSKQIYRINKLGESPADPDIFEDYLVVFNDHKYKIYYDDSDYTNIVYLADGSRIFDKNVNDPTLSPGEHFAVWFDDTKNQIFSCELDSKEKKTSVAKVPLLDDRFHNIVGWDTIRHCILITDQFDIWRIDLLGVDSPVNMTNGFGRKNNIAFSIFGFRDGNDGDVPDGKYSVIQSERKLLLTGFNLNSGENGFWMLPNAIYATDPLKLRQGLYAWTIGMVPIKAKFKEKYLIIRQSATEFPNLCVTSDFKTFFSISDLHPEKTYNWLTDELITWKKTDGDTSRGILYKPENFDPRKRYPIIFQYYTGLGNRLNNYPRPDWSKAEMDISYFVSNGYLVFVPDIQYKPGQGGQNIVNSVVSAASFLSRLPYVDSTKMGLQGHSFAGWETDYLITHSNIFAAACAVAGVSDQISNFNELATAGEGLFPAEYLETSNPGAPYGRGATPSTRPDLYEKNSPVLAVENATTPLLLVGGNLDGAVPFRQDLEMYLAMRRAGKRVWLLQYEKGNHALAGDMAKDFTIRLKQFFDYYLKDDSPPVWMTKGVRAVDKGIKTGLELDTSGALP